MEIHSPSSKSFINLKNILIFQCFSIRRGSVSRSRRVGAPNRQPTLQTSQTSNKPTKGRVYPPPSPSLPPRLAWPEAGSRVTVPSWKSKKRRVLPFDLHLGRARTDQGRQHTHHIGQLMVPWPNSSPHALILHIFLKISSLNIPYTTVIYRTLE